LNTNEDILTTTTTTTIIIIIIIQTDREVLADSPDIIVKTRRTKPAY
jgi:hypothetical protein